MLLAAYDPRNAEDAAILRGMWRRITREVDMQTLIEAGYEWDVAQDGWRVPGNRGPTFGEREALDGLKCWFKDSIVGGGDGVA